VVIFVDGRNFTVPSNTFLERLYGDMLNEIFETINPFTKTDPETRISCIVLPVEISDGQLGVNPEALLRTDKIRVVSEASINLKSEKIEMTTPVAAVQSGDNTYTISFMMPVKYSLETLPEPVSEGIRFKEVPAQQVAVIRFSGTLDENVAARKQDELGAWLEGNGLTPRGNFASAQYNPPWIPGFARKNEVMVPV